MSIFKRKPKKTIEEKWFWPRAFAEIVNLIERLQPPCERCGGPIQILARPAKDQTGKEFRQELAAICRNCGARQ